MFKKRLIASIVAATFSASANASIQSDMQAWFNELGAYSNVSGPQFLQSQTGTTFTGGSLYMRMPQRNYQLASVALPSVKAGCGGIDLFAGAFSFMNSEQLTAMLRNLANNAIGVAFELAIESISPQLSNILKWAQDQASKINNLSINSCKWATGLMTAAWPDRKAAEKVATRKGVDPQAGLSRDAFMSWFNNVNESTSEKQRNEHTIVQRNPNLKDTFTATNVTWSALGRLGVDSWEMRELMMSMIGTVIITPTPGDGSKPRFEVKAPPQNISFKDFIGEREKKVTNINIMKCLREDPGCLNPVTGPATLSSFWGHTNKLVEEMVMNVRHRRQGNLTPEQYAILQGTNIPLWKLISLTPTGYAAHNYLNNLSRAIAIDLAYTYFDTIAKEVHKAVANSQATDSASTMEQLKRMEERISDVRKDARAMLIAELTKFESGVNVMYAVAQLHQQVMMGLPRSIRESLDLFGVPGTRR